MHMHDPQRVSGVDLLAAALEISLSCCLACLRMSMTHYLLLSDGELVQSMLQVSS
jgi:hypothetical protein